MVNVIKKSAIEEKLKRKIDFICGFCNTTQKFINGSIRTIDKTNLIYIEPHRVIIKGIIDRLFIYNNIQMQFFKQQFDKEHQENEAKERNKQFDIFKTKQKEIQVHDYKEEENERKPKEKEDDFKL